MWQKRRMYGVTEASAKYLNIGSRQTVDAGSFSFYYYGVATFIMH